MADILPSINTATFEEAVRRIRMAEPFVKWIHLDIADGSFTAYPTWNDPAFLKNFATPLNVELHFMVKNPEEKISEWMLPLISRIIFHYEATNDPSGLIAFCHAAGKEAGVAIRPETDVQVLAPFVGAAEVLQLLAVVPGPSGQAFNPAIPEKIRSLRALSKTQHIEIDGGIRVGTAHECITHGADMLAAASSLFESGESFEVAYQKLLHDAGI